jgi:ditrans,polycis-polyprenyl diphosphate synthase
VKVVTVYAFSIENFKRSKYEVDNLMDMAKLRLSQIAAHGHILDKYGAKIQLLGRRELVRPDVLESIDKAIERTKNNTKLVPPIPIKYLKLIVQIGPF